MGKRIELPRKPQGQPEKQLEALYSYLYQMAEALNSNLADIGGNELTDRERKQISQIIGTKAEDGDRSEAETLKSLIVKTASYVQNELDYYRINLLGDYVAEGKFGKYVRRTGLDVDVTPTGIQQNYTFQEIIQGLKTYEINAKNYIKTGLLRTVNSIPVYGVAIGKDVVTFASDGTETYNDGNKVAELTADELSFWQGGNKIAGYTGNRISFYYGNTAAFYIENGKLYCADDMEIASGKMIKLNNWLINQTGLVYTGSTNRKLYFGEKTSIPTSVYAAIMGYLDQNDTCGKVELLASTFDSVSAVRLITECKKYYRTGSAYPHYRGSVYIDSNAGYNSFGSSAHRIDYIHADSIVGRTTQEPSSPYHISSEMKIEFHNEVNYSDDGTGPAFISILYENDTQPERFKIEGRYKADPENSSAYTEAKFKIVGTMFFDTVYGQNFITNSSKDIKHDIRDMEDVGERLDALRPVTFVYDNDPDEQTRHGLIYEEAIGVMPEICTGNDSEKGVNYMELVPMLLKEVQELRARVKALEERGGTDNVSGY